MQLCRSQSRMTPLERTDASRGLESQCHGECRLPRNIRPGLFAATSGIEVQQLYAASVAALAFTGPGRYSLDALVGPTGMWTTANAGIARGLAAVGATANLAARQ